jgi:Rrf2 family protein
MFDGESANRARSLALIYTISIHIVAIQPYGKPDLHERCGMNVVAPLDKRPRDGRGAGWPSAKTIYALRACIALAAADPATRMKTHEIAQAAGVPKGFLSKILGELRTAGIVSAQRGYRGGYSLTRSPDTIRVDELLRAVGTRDPFSTLLCATDIPVPFIEHLRSRLHALAVEALHGASLAELAAAPRKI